VHKRLLLLGLLRSGPLSGYELHQIVRAHGELYADLKKANIYYLLERLADEGLVTVEVEGGTRGRRGERLIYQLTAAGRAEFRRLIGEVVLELQPVQSGIDVAVVFLATLSKRQALSLLEKRRARLAARREQAAAELEPAARAPLGQVVADHLLGQIDAEIAWLARTLEFLDGLDWDAVRKPRVEAAATSH
jgi:DNA-binding PadR family transcriptional regulator